MRELSWISEDYVEDSSTQKLMKEKKGEVCLVVTAETCISLLSASSGEQKLKLI